MDWANYSLIILYIFYSKKRKRNVVYTISSAISAKISVGECSFNCLNILDTYTYILENKKIILLDMTTVYTFSFCPNVFGHMSENIQISFNIRTSFFVKII